jgi:hypothetical protein
MPKPVLSDSLFNADDVATAVLQEANLQVANSNLGVTDFSTDITIDSAWNRSNSAFDSPPLSAVHFNGLVFIYGGLKTTDTTPSYGATVFTIPSNYHPARIVMFPSISYQSDSVLACEISTSGVCTLMDINQEGSTNFYLTFNFWYKV